MNSQGGLGALPGVVLLSPCAFANASGVFGAKCTEFTLKPRLVLTNASEQKLLVRTLRQNVTSENRRNGWLLNLRSLRMLDRLGYTK